MDPEVEYELNNEQQFWDELDKTISQEVDTHDRIDDALRSYLTLTTASLGKYIDSDYNLDRCSYKLACSPLFGNHADYVRRQFVHCLLQEDELDILLVATSLLLVDARSNEQTFELLNYEGVFPRLVSLIASPKQDEEEGLHRLLMELFYEMARIQKISLDDLAHVDDDFVRGLFDIIELVSGDVSDPYHYPVIRVLLVLNEQFMVAAHDPDHAKSSIPLTNKVVKVLSAQGSKYKTFGENIILLLNREDETSLQLLTLKLLYLLFTTPSTYEYFYTNDLRVLVDILIRNLLDLPEEATPLRHTYLRVLYPLLEHTQLQSPPHYKRDEIRKLLTVLSGGQILDSQDGSTTIHHWSHFDEVDDTTKRLVKRCQSVSWLIEESEPPLHVESPTDDTGSGPSSPASPSKTQPPALPAPRKLKKRNSSKGSTLTVGQYLTPQLESARQSSLSMMEMAAQKEKPGVITPSRNPSLKHGLRAAMLYKKEKPPPPKARRSAWTRMKVERSTTELAVTNTTVSEESTRSAIEHSSLESMQQPDQPDREEATDSKASPPAITVAPPFLKPSHKKPPPAPKARRWRGKRAKEEDEGGGGGGHQQPPREPGKFDAKLPSIITTSASEDRASEIGTSPFPLTEEKTLSPKLVHDVVGNQPAASVSEALGQAQAQAITGIEETLERAQLHDTSSGGGGNEIAPPPAVVLAPPNPAPPREVPGPRWELERSPFLSDAEEEEDEVDEVDEEDHARVAEVGVERVTQTGRADRGQSHEGDGESEIEEDEWNDPDDGEAEGGG